MARFSLKQMTHTALLLGLVVTIVLGSSGTFAQDDAAERIRAAYAAHDDWQTYTVQAEITAWSAIVADGAYDSGKSYWRRQERGASVAGMYDLSVPDDMTVLLAVSGSADLSVQVDGTETSSTWSTDMHAALSDGDLYWHGTFEADPASNFALPSDWEMFSTSDLGQVPAFTDLGLRRYLGQDALDPFVGDTEAWLDAAESIEGPDTIKLGGGATGDVYTVTLPLSAAPELIGSRVSVLTEGPTALVTRDALLAQIAEDGTLVWRVVIDPTTGALIGQELQGDVNTELSGDALTDPYVSLSVAYSERQSVLFSAIDEPVESLDVTANRS
ncbi:hypothetical protein [Aggregatilinea lenta]|uniref:hypothetical protein n=1 Tax=Aggregatilinea lenta TaxID=913108 RepID=UPI0013C35662|nr:hypothetical protein [Aggregatilinea lenta]